MNLPRPQDYGHQTWKDVATTMPAMTANSDGLAYIDTIAEAIANADNVSGDRLRVMAAAALTAIDLLKDQCPLCRQKLPRHQVWCQFTTQEGTQP